MHMIQYQSKRLTPICQAMPTILFGSKEDSHVAKQQQDMLNPFELSRIKFETLRWKYHALWNNYRNGFQKVLMNLQLLPSTDMILTNEYAYNPHQPSNESCRRMTLFPETAAVRQYPLTINHYIGSYERYSKRKQDFRRSRQV